MMHQAPASYGFGEWRRFLRSTVSLITLAWACRGESVRIAETVRKTAYGA